MKLFGWRWFAVSSLLVGTLVAKAETRPQYGGTVRVTMREAPVSLDPADRTVADSFGRRSLSLLLFDTLVTIDDSGRVEASLAESWQVRDGHRWQFRVRQGVNFQDGAALTPEIVAASLRFANPSWNITAEGDMVGIDRNGSVADFLAELALPRNAIAKRGADGKLSGTGPFRVSEWEPGKRLTVAANDGCWRGRPFLDAIEIQMGRSNRDQVADVQLGRTDFVEVAPEQAHRLGQEGRRLASSRALELIALVFERDAAPGDEKVLREALAWSLERSSMRDVLLQGAGEPSASILPTWISGYGFVFSTNADLTKARQLRGQVRTAVNWKLGYDNSNPTDRLLAERIALNAKDAGLPLQPVPSGAVDVRLVRIPLSSSEPQVALANAVSETGLTLTVSSGNSAEVLYDSEQSLLTTRRIIPLFHVPASYLSKSTLRNWTLREDGSWNFADAWLENSKP
jgi:peptide/nickel transport system substrate-binding protein